jgi:integrase
MGKRYELNVICDGPRRFRAGVTLANGRRHYVRGTSAQDVRDRARALQGHAAAGTLPPSRVSVAQAAENWRTNVLPYLKLAPATIAQYDTYARLIAAEVGRRRLAELRPGAIQAFLVDLGSRGYGRNTVRIVRHVLKAVFAQAVLDGLVPHNYAADTKLGTIGRDPTERDPYGREELAALLGAAAGDRLEALWVLLLTTGCRRVEACSIRWSDVDLDGATVHFPVSKTAGGVRTVPLSATAARALRAHQRAQAAEQLAAAKWDAGGWVFTNTVGRPLDPSRYQRAWRALVGRAGVDGVAHELRHSVASHASDAGLSDADVAAQLGISKETLNRHYYKRTTPVGPAVAGVMEDLIGRPASRQK